MNPIKAIYKGLRAAGGVDKRRTTGSPYVPPGFHQLRVKRVYQRASTGTKAIIVWKDSKQRQDAWFEGEWPRRGERLYVRGRTSYGWHNRNPQVFYINKGDIWRG